MESVLSLQFLCESKTIVKFKAYYITYIKPPTDWLSGVNKSINIHFMKCSHLTFSYLILSSNNYHVYI